MKKFILMIALAFSGLHAESIYATFDVEPEKTAELSLTTSGTIKGINVDVGSKVKKGDVLLWLDNRDLKAALDLARAQLELARTDAKFARRNFERYEKVKNVIDAGEYDRYASAYESAQSRVREAEANVRYKQALLDKTVLTAPFDGVIYDKPVELGDVVSGKGASAKSTRPPTAPTARSSSKCRPGESSRGSSARVRSRSNNV
ncbi:MAG: efflux RND transporter periplasmic adaptor subunit [Campylobacterales bacterium]